MLAKLLRLPIAAWVLVALMAVFSGGVVFLLTQHSVPNEVVLYGVQPIAATTIAGAAYWATRGRGTRARHIKDKAIIVGSVIAMWFVLYFAAGIFLTYTHNALVTTWQGLLLNIIGFGITAAAVEYTRHRLLLLAGQRNAIWFGAIATIVFATQQMNLGRLALVHTTEDVIKLILSDIIPAIVSSALLTYLALSSGLPAMLVYRLGVVAVAIFVPIIPKFDWYLLGISSLLLAVAIYIAVDHTQRTGRQPRIRRDLNIALEVCWSASIIGLILFMTGFFAYKPSAIMSNSMEPAFSRGSVVVVQKIDEKIDINIGDIIQYERGNIMITHRVVDITQASNGSGSTVYITKGDNNPSRDEPVPASLVRGIIRSQVPYIGYPAVWLRELTMGSQSNQINK